MSREDLFRLSLLCSLATDNRTPLLLLLPVYDPEFYAVNSLYLWCKDVPSLTDYFPLAISLPNSPAYAVGHSDAADNEATGILHLIRDHMNFPSL